MKNYYSKPEKIAEQFRLKLIIERAEFEALLWLADGLKFYKPFKTSEARPLNQKFKDAMRACSPKFDREDTKQIPLYSVSINDDYSRYLKVYFNRTPEGVKHANNSLTVWPSNVPQGEEITVAHYREAVDKQIEGKRDYIAKLEDDQKRLEQIIARDIETREAVAEFRNSITYYTANLLDGKDDNLEAN